MKHYPFRLNFERCALPFNSRVDAGILHVYVPIYAMDVSTLRQGCLILILLLFDLKKIYSYFLFPWHGELQLINLWAYLDLVSFLCGN